MFNPASKKRYLHNYIDKTFQDMLFPLHAVLDVMFLPNFYMLDGFVTPNSHVQIFKAFSLTVVLIVITFFRFEKSFVLDNGSNTSISFTVISIYFDLFYYCFIFISLFVSNVINTTSYVNLVLNLQKALRNNRCIRNVNHVLKCLTFGNWASMVSIPVYYVFCFTTNGVYTVGALLNFLPLLYFDVSVIFTIRVIHIIKDELRIWVDEQRLNIQELENNADVKLKGKIIFESYCYIFDAYQLFAKVGRVPIFFQIVETISHLLIYLQINIEQTTNLPENKISDLWHNFGRISISVWVMKNGILLWILCNTCEKFYSLVKQAETMCNEALMLEITDDYRLLCKNVRRYNCARFTRLRVCGATVDARLPLQIARILAVYAAIILQFDFL